MSHGYPFKFVMNDTQPIHPQMLYTLQYRFKSERSHHTYIVRAECYKDNVYCLKFYDKNNVDSVNKYSLRTNTGEPRTILYTIYDIAIDILKKDPLASFFFIGAEDERDTEGHATRRYRFYRRFTASIIGTEQFDHLRVSELSLYILINRKQDKTNLAEDITEYVKDAFREYNE